MWRKKIKELEIKIALPIKGAYCDIPVDIVMEIRKERERQ